MKKLIPILFSTPMVLALLAGTKTQTRRIVKCPKNFPEDIWQAGQGHFDIQPAHNREGYDIWEWESDSCRKHPLPCPYGQPGDVLWVRETFAPTININHDADWPGRPHTQLEGYDDGYGVYIYRADGEWQWLDDDGFTTERSCWKPSLFMPLAACRLFLEIVSVRVERLQEISEADAIAEGIARTPVTTTDGMDGVRYQNYRQRYDINHPLHRWTASPLHSYRSLWEKINGPDSWKANPYVWVVELKQTEKPADND